MSKLQKELEVLRQRCMQLESQLVSSGREVVHLTQQQQDATEDIASLRASVSYDFVAFILLPQKCALHF